MRDAVFVTEMDCDRGIRVGTNVLGSTYKEFVEII